MEKLGAAQDPLTGKYRLDQPIGTGATSSDTTTTTSGSTPVHPAVASAGLIAGGLSATAIISLVTGVAVGSVLGSAFDATRRAVGIRYPWEAPLHRHLRKLRK
jgi:hypothetical protein